MAAQRRPLHGHVPPAVRTLAAVDRLPEQLRLNLSIGLPLRDPAGLDRLLHQLYDPTSPLYGHYLSAQEFTERFGPTQSDYQAVIDFFAARGFKINAQHSNRLVLDVSGTVSQIESAFATQLRLYRHPKENRLFFAPAIEPTVQIPIQDIAGLDDYLVPRPASLRPVPLANSAVPNAGSAPGGSYRGYDFRAAYLPGVALSGTGQSVGLLEFDGYYSSDIAAYEAGAGLPSVPLQNVLLNNFNGSPGANNSEVALDIEVAIAVAPALSSVLVYEGSSVNTMLNRMAADNRAKQLSSSWTFGINNTTENIFREFAAQGQSYFQASGDDGAYSGGIPSPADYPNVTVVGGTTLSTAGSKAGWVSETTWNWAVTGMGTNASGGGISTTYAIPAYQKGLDMSVNQGSTTMRNIPDVAITADNIWVIWDNGSKGAFGGTSASTPLWAAFMALVNQQAIANGRSTIGFANPALYAIASGTNYSSCFHDITTGNNSNPGSPNQFYAVPGYDLCTGLGSPAGQPLINALAGGTNLPPVFRNNPFTISNAIVGQPYSGSISNQATDPNPGDPLTFAKISGPSWLSVGPSGTLSGIPSPADTGNNTFTVSAAESAGMSNTATLSLTVLAPPRFTSNPMVGPNAMAGASYALSIAPYATDPDPGDSLSFAKASGPAWLTVTPNGVISGTPSATDVGTNIFSVSVTDSGGLSASAALSILVNDTNFNVHASLQVNALQLSWTGSSPSVQVQLSTNLASGLWQNVGGTVTNGTLTIVPSGPSAFYRVKVTAP